MKTHVHFCPLSHTYMPSDQVWISPIFWFAAFMGWIVSPFLNWSIVDSQYCIRFRCTASWLSVFTDDAPWKVRTGWWLQFPVLRYTSLLPSRVHFLRDEDVGDGQLTLLLSHWNRIQQKKVVLEAEMMALTRLQFLLKAVGECGGAHSCIPGLWQGARTDPSWPVRFESRLCGLAEGPRCE